MSVLSISIVVAALLLSWICAAIHSSINAVERTRVEEGARNEQSRASILLRLLDNPPRSLAPISFVNAAALITLAAVTALIVDRSGRPALALLVLAVWLAGRLIADSLAIARAWSVALLVARPLSFLLALSSPFLAFGGWLGHRAKGGRTRAMGTERVTSDDIQIIVAEGDQERKLEEIEPEEREMIAGIIEMGERTARDIMIPRLDAIAIEASAPLEQALDIAAKYGHSRLPVYEGDIDHIIGILHVKDLIPALRRPDQQATLEKFVRPVHYVPDTAKADELLRELLRNRVHMAVVVDEYGGTVGIVTIEDALEEIVGEIRDEYDVAEEPEFVQLNPNEAVFNGRIPIGEVNDVMAIGLPEEESDTLGGLVYTRLGRMPKVNDTLEIGPAELKVTAMTGRRIKKVLVRKLEPKQTEEVVPTQSDGQNNQPE